MKKLKIILLCSYIFIILYTIITISKPIKDVDEEITLYGTILDINKKEEYTSLIIQSKCNKYLVYTNNNNYLLGQKVYIKGVKKTPEKNRNFYLFNYQNYLKSLRIHYIIHSTEEKIIKSPNLLFKLKNSFLNYINHFENKEYFLAFLYGKNELDDDVYENYKSIGIVHLFALSGMHIHLLISILDKLFQKKKRVTIIFLIFYLLFVNPSPSIYRATLSEIIYRILKKRINKKQIILFLFFINLLYNPYCIYHIGFQLSYIISFVLIRSKRKEKNYFKNLFSTSFLAFLASMPILINQSFEINFLTTIWNLLLIPFVSYLLFPSIIFTFLIPPLEFILSYEVNLLENITYFLSQIDVFIISFSHLNIIEFLILYLIIFLSIYKPKFYAILLIFLIYKYFSHYFITTPKITFIDVNQGDSIMIEYPKNMGAILIDTGGIKDREMTQSTLIPTLKSRGIKYLDILVLTHGDYDHIGNAYSLIKNFKIKNVIMNSGDNNENEIKIINLCKQKNIPFYNINKDIVNYKNIQLQFINSKSVKNENKDSLVTYMNFVSYNILLMGDATEEEEINLINKYKLPKMDILKVGHHGSKYSSNKSFLDVIRPTYAFIQSGKHNLYGHPHNETIKRFESIKTTIYSTSDYGMIEVKLKNKLSVITSLKPATQ